MAQVAAVHENADRGHQADIPQMEGKKGGKIANAWIKERTRRAFTVPPISAAIRPNLEEQDEGEGDREHHLQGQEGLLPEKVMLMQTYKYWDSLGSWKRLESWNTLAILRGKREKVCS